jgi:DNA-binding transcriptional regulator YdaS (Cro superfamily)
MVAMTNDKPLNEAFGRVGGVRALARMLGLTHPTLVRWKKTPAAHVLALEKLTGISRYRLRPDVFGPDPKGHKR